MKLLNKCPVCGGRLREVAYYMFTREYLIKLNGEVSLADCEKSKDTPSDYPCSIRCTECSFITGTDLEVIEPKDLDLYIVKKEDGKYYYDD